MKIGIRILGMCLAISLFTPSSSGGNSQKAPFLRKLSGTGRACTGNLTVGERLLTWDTPFSRCLHVPYEILKQEKEGEHLKVVYRLKQQSGKCYTPIILLSHEPDDAPGQRGWGAIGYPTKKAWLDNDTTDALACNLEPVEVKSSF